MCRGNIARGDLSPMTIRYGLAAVAVIVAVGLGSGRRADPARCHSRQRFRSRMDRFLCRRRVRRGRRGQQARIRRRPLSHHLRRWRRQRRAGLDLWRRRLSDHPTRHHRPDGRAQLLGLPGFGVGTGAGRHRQRQLEYRPGLGGAGARRRARQPHRRCSTWPAVMPARSSTPTASPRFRGASASFSTDQTVNGWTIGPGFETMLGRNWSGKLEYRYSQFGRTTLAGTQYRPDAVHPRRPRRPHLPVRRAGRRCRPTSRRRRDRPTSTGPASMAASPPAPAWASARSTALAGTASASFDSGGQGLLGSVFAGADYQFSPYALVGVMGDFTWTGIAADAHHHDAGRRQCLSSRPNPTANGA